MSVPSVAAPHGQVSALGAGGSLALLVRVAGGRRASLAAGAGASRGLARVSRRAGARRRGSRVREPARGRRACGCSAGWRSGDPLHGTAGLDGGVALRGVEATDAGEVVASARGVDAGRDARTGGAVKPRSASRSRRLASSLAAAGCTRSGEVLRPADGGGPVVLQLTDVRLAAGFGHACAVAAGTLPAGATTATASSASRRATPARGRRP